MKKSNFLLILVALLLSVPASAQFSKLKNKVTKTKDKVTNTNDSKSTADRNKANADLRNQAPLDEIWHPEVEPITDPTKITDEYLKKVTNIADWMDTGRMSNLEVRHIKNLFKRIGIMAKYASGRVGGSSPLGSKCDFIIKDCEVIRYEAINLGEQPSVDGNEYHVLGFKSAYYCADEVYNTPFHKELREKWFPAAEAIRDYALNKWGTSFQYIKIHEEYGGNIPMCSDKNGKPVRCRDL